MNSKTKKILMGSLTLGTIAAPVASLVACDSSSETKTEYVTSPDSDDTGLGMTVGELKAKLSKQSDASTASSNFISQIKYELAESLYNREQQSSFDYQKAFLRWNIFTAKKDLLALAKEVAALYGKADSITSAQIVTDENPTGTNMFIGKALDMTFTSGYNSTELFTFVNGLKDDSSTSAIDANKATFKTKVQLFKTNFKSVQDLETKLKNIDQLKDENNAGWTSTSLSSDYPKLKKPISKITADKTSTYNEAKAPFIDKYKTKGGGTEEWTKERTSTYNGASTDEEAIKYLVNQEIQATAFGQFTYALNDSFTIEQALATYTENGTIHHIFPWFETSAMGGKIGDKTPSTEKFKVWTNSIAEFNNAAGDAIDINTDNIVDASDKIVPLLSNKVFFLGRNTLSTEEIIVDLNSPNEMNYLQHAPISITHSLIKATQDKTNPNLPWTIDKDSLKNLFDYFGDPDRSKAKTGISLFSNLYKKGNDDDLYNQFVSDDTGSRPNNGELGVQTYQWYARQGGMNDGFALATMVAYSNMQQPKYALANSIKPSTDGENIIKDLKSKLETNMKADLTNVTSTAEANKRIDSWIYSLSDTDLKSQFGTIFTSLFNARPVVYELEKSDPSSSAASTRYLLASPDSGVHIINIISGAPVWYDKYQTDMRENVASENNISKAKVDWAKLYADYFQTSDSSKADKVVSDLLNNQIYKDEYKNVIAGLVTKTDDTTKKLIDEWIKAGYVKFGDKDTDAEKGQKIIDAANKAIEASNINTNSQNSINALTGRIGTYLIGQMDSKYIDPTIDPTSLYNELLKSLVEN